MSPNQGKLLYLLTKISGAGGVLEIGTLGGYSTTWLARALPDEGTVISLELDQKHADVARKNIDRAGVGSRVTIQVGPAAADAAAADRAARADVRSDLHRRRQAGLPAYLDLSLQLSRPGTVILADNLIRDGAVLDEAPEEENARAARAFNAKLAAEVAARIDHHSGPRQENRRDVDLDSQIKRLDDPDHLVRDVRLFERRDLFRRQRH